MSAQTHRRWLQALAVGATVILTPLYVGNSADAANLFDDPFFFRGERFAPLTLIAGQGLSAAVSNVLIPKQAGAQTACPVEVRFFAADASLIEVQSLQLPPGASASVPVQPAPGLYRTIVSLPADFADPDGICALKSDVDIFDAPSGGTLSVVPGQLCLGQGECSARGKRHP